MKKWVNEMDSRKLEINKELDPKWSHGQDEGKKIV